MNKPDKIVKTEYDEKVYNKLKMQDLIVFGIYSVVEMGEKCTYERLVAECFDKFPKVFGFKRYPQWPDSLKFDRPLRTLRKEGLIVGSVRGYLELTEFGKRIAKETEAILDNKVINISKRMRQIGRSADDRSIEYFRESELFAQFRRHPENFTISESEFRSLLRCTLETPERVLKQNLEYYKNVAKSYNEKQLLEFLITCEKKFLKRGGKNG